MPNHKPVFMTDDEKLAGNWVMGGKILAYPSESVWGLGCNPFDEQAVLRLLEIKQRPKEKGLIVVVADELLVSRFLDELPLNNQKHILESWNNIDNQRTQATTWLFPIPKQLPIGIPDWVIGDQTTLAIRKIGQVNAAKLCQNMISISNPYGFLVSTSCNPSQHPPAKTLSEAYHYFFNMADVGYLQGDTTGFKMPSQIRCALTGQVVRA